MIFPKQLFQPSTFQLLYIIRGRKQTTKLLVKSSCKSSNVAWSQTVRWTSWNILQLLHNIFASGIALIVFEKGQSKLVRMTFFLKSDKNRQHEFHKNSISKIKLFFNLLSLHILKSKFNKMLTAKWARNLKIQLFFLANESPQSARRIRFSVTSMDPMSSAEPRRWQNLFLSLFY